MRIDKSALERWFASPLFIPVVLFLLTLAMFADPLFSASGRVISYQGTDLVLAFTQMRQFGYTQLRHGHIPLWNPHEFCGIPFVGGWQSAMFYPPNWIYLALPVGTAANCEVALHVFLVGWFMSIWTAHYRLHPLACLLAGVMVMFGGPYFLHVFAGHLAPLDAMAWAPLILCTVDMLLDRPTVKWVLIGALAAAMALFAGHPQTVFNVLVAAVVYIALRLWKVKERRKALLALVSVGILGLALAAIQVLTGLQAATESTRHGAVTYGFASLYSLPPENLITSVAPGFFGDGIRLLYFGRWQIWEMQLYMGIVGLVLAIYGANRAGTPQRRIFVIMVITLLIFALGANTPIFHLLYDFVPGFNKFRGHSKFNYPCCLFVAMLAAHGYDRLLKTWNEAATVIVGLILAPITLCIGGLGLYLRFTSGAVGDGGLWDQILRPLADSGQGMAAERYAEIEFVNNARHFAGLQCLIAAGVLLVLTVLFLRISYSRRTCYALVVIAILEMFVFARSTVQTFNPAILHLPAIEKYLAAHPDNNRMANGLPPSANFWPNLATFIGRYDLWGDDPAVLGRYAELMFFLNGHNPNEASDMLVPNREGPVMAMLRCRYGLFSDGAGMQLKTYPDPLPHLLLVTQWAQIQNRDAILAAIDSSQFDPHSSIILETAPNPAPEAGGEQGTVRMLAETTDSLTIEADLPKPAILLVTDAYSKEWHAAPLPGSSQQQYQVLPADYALRAVPLGAGKHRLRMEYLPAAYVIGRWISISAIILYLLLLVGTLLRGKQTVQPAANERPLPNPEEQGPSA